MHLRCIIVKPKKIPPAPHLGNVCQINDAPPPPIWEMVAKSDANNAHNLYPHLPPFGKCVVKMMQNKPKITTPVRSPIVKSDENITQINTPCSLPNCQK